MNNVWFTADTHFGHKRAAEIRNFASIEEMDEILVSNWNKLVRRGDRVYHLGDFALGDRDSAASLAHRLNGNIYLIRGNHDNVASHTKVRDRFVWIKDYFNLKIGQQKIVLCHYALRTWNCIHHGAINLFGHSHGRLPKLEHLRQMDVGVDCHDFRPISFETVMTCISQLQS